MAFLMEAAFNLVQIRIKLPSNHLTSRWCWKFFTQSVDEKSTFNCSFKQELLFVLFIILFRLLLVVFCNSFWDGGFDLVWKDSFTAEEDADETGEAEKVDPASRHQCDEQAHKTSCDLRLGVALCTAECCWADHEPAEGEEPVQVVGCQMLLQQPFGVEAAKVLLLQLHHSENLKAHQKQQWKRAQSVESYHQFSFAIHKMFKAHKRDK